MKESTILLILIAIFIVCLPILYFRFDEFHLQYNFDCCVQHAALYRDILYYKYNYKFPTYNRAAKTPEIHYRSELWDHLFFDDCLNYLNFNYVSDEICTLNNVKAIKVIFKISPEWSYFVKFWRNYCKKSQNFNVFLNFKHLSK